MPRWAEAVSLATVAIIAVVALLVYAKFTTSKVQKQASAAADKNEELVKEAQTIPDAPAIQIERETTPADRAAARAAAERAALDRAKVRVATDTPEALPSPGPTANEKPAPEPPEGLMGPPVEAAGGVVADAADSTVPETEPFVGPPIEARGGNAAYAQQMDEEAAKTVEEMVEDKAPAPYTGIVPGSAEELALVEDAQASLERLYNLRLRPDVAPDVAEKEAAKLQSIIDRLPPKTARSLHELIEKGYNRRLRGETDAGKAAEAASLQDAEAGRVDDAPKDVRALRDQTRKMRQRLGAPGRPRPATTRPTVNPTRLPAAKPSNVKTGGGAGGLPSVKANPI